MSKVSVITFRDIEEAVMTARTAMVGYIQCAVNKSADKTLEISLTRSTDEPFKYEADNGRRYIIRTINLKREHNVYTVTYNRDCQGVYNFNDLSSDELFTLCSILDKFLGDEAGIVDDNTIDIECEIIN